MKNIKGQQSRSSRSEPTLLDALEAAERALSHTAELQEHFREDLDWMALRRQAWRTRVWRVGLIGITSSGKSTLVNALLGQKLLPSAVRPSSNTLVVCRRGAQRHAVVHYLDGRTEHVVEARIGARLSQLCDELTNPDNQLGVQEVEVFSPTFRLGEDVALVDTPGLDATDAHERLTLVEFLPTVDMVVFLTTAKTSSDGAVSSYMKRISEEGKPLVLVQNMIDSIAPKLGPGGVIQRSRAEVAGDHLQRLQRLVKTSLGEMGASVPILQVSAIEALRASEEASNIPKLVAAIEGHLRVLEPTLVLGRCEQLARHLQHIIRREGSTLGLTPKGGSYAHDEQQSLSTLEQGLDELGKVFHRKLTKLQKATASAAARFEQQVNELKEREVEVAARLVRELKDWHTQTEGSVIAALDDANATLSDLARELNLRFEDYLLASPRQAYNLLEVPTQEKFRTTKRKKQGVLAMLSRFFGSESGYELRTSQWEVVDLDALRPQVLSSTQTEVEWLQESASRLQQSIQGRQQRLREEIERRRRALEQYLRSAAKLEERQQAMAALIPLHEWLEARLRERRPALAPAPVNGAVKESSVRCEAAPHVVALLELACQLSRRRLLAAREHCLARIERRHPQARHRALLWAWDADALGRFVQRFWSDLLPPVGEEFTGIKSVTTPHRSSLKEALLCVHAEGRTSEETLRQAVDAFLQVPATTFLLIDIEQPGASLRMLQRSPLAKSLVRSQGLILVPQSLRGVLNSQTLAEALLELRRLAQSFPLRVDGLLANHDSLALSHLIDRLLLEGDQLRTLVDEQTWLAELKDTELPTGFEAAPVLRAWRETLSIPRVRP